MTNERNTGGATVKLSTLILVVILPLFGYLYANSVQNVDNLRSGCNRANPGRQTFYDFIESAIKVREASAKASTDTQEKAINLRAANEYKSYAEQLVDAVSEVALYPGSPKVDCDVAYPKPWPLN